MSKNDRTTMTPRRIGKAFLVFLGPLMLSSVLQSLSGTINSVFLGHMLGVKALAVAAAFFPIMRVLIAFMMGLGMGASVLIGQAWGARQTERVRAVAGTIITCCLLAGLLIALAGIVLAPTVLKMLATPEEILVSAVTYARVMLLAVPGTSVLLITSAIMRGAGDMLTPLKALAISTAVGLVLTPVLIRGLLGLPPAGAASAAYAALVSPLVALMWLGFHLHRKRHPLAPSLVLLRHMRIEPRIFKSVTRIGVPAAVPMVTMSLAEATLLSIVNGFGAAATASYGVGNQILNYVQLPAMSIAIAASILGSQAIGAGETERLGAITRAGLFLSALVTGTLLLVCYLFSASLVGFFTDDAEVVAVSQGMLNIVLWGMLLFGASMVLSAVMRSSGVVVPPTIFAVSAIVLVELPAAFLLSRRMGIEGVWWAYPLAFATMLTCQATFYRLVWRRREIVALVN